MTLVVDLSVAAVERLTRDIARSSSNLTLDEVRYLVSLYYDLQDVRIGTGHQERMLESESLSHEVITWAKNNFGVFEKQITRALDRWTDEEPVGIGVWLKGIVGIGPIISAGLLSHIDIRKSPDVSHIWSFAGLNPNAIWGKGERRPWNTKLKTLCVFKAGESFVKVQNNPNDVYGKLYAQRKAKEILRNESGGFAEQAARALEAKRYRKETESYRAYSMGKLPAAHLHARARRYAVKIFLSHVWEVWYTLEFGEAPARPYAQAHLEHPDYIPPPNMPPLLAKARHLD